MSSTLRNTEIGLLSAPALAATPWLTAPATAS
ncbi:glycoside hydrolase family 16 protein, partial [Streptomyces javensis]|nr:glycoside hydrolase family 16 protein [Streptomyces javensis]